MSVHSRKDIERQLEKARKDYNDARGSYDTTRGQSEALNKLVSQYLDRMNGARTSLTQLSSDIQDMDLTGASGIRDRGNARTHLIDNKEYHLDKNELDIKLVPWRDHKKTLVQPTVVQPENIAETYSEAIDLLKKD